MARPQSRRVVDAARETNPENVSGVARMTVFPNDGSTSSVLATASTRPAQSSTKENTSATTATGMPSQLSKATAAEEAEWLRASKKRTAVITILAESHLSCVT